MSITDEMTRGAVQYRTAKVEDIDQAKGEMLVRAAPYDVVVDLLPDVSEVFHRGTFARAVKAPQRLSAYWEHGGPLIGRGIEADDRADGIWVRAKIGRTTAAKDVMALYEDGLLTDVSAEFRPIAEAMKVERSGSKIAISHTRAHLLGFAATTDGVYGDSAFIASMRDLKSDKAREEARAWLIEQKRRSFTP